ncbi:hypothetical protein SADUNF_Sadunf08G0163200 [Salix dunnii]|uniref:Bet v I/Major latex protein domain-containing protein n=1 Tax=Salix dunnii TaxID=1413687 RepID=A0A835K3J9_9ROSI|nr:hypothetical protein SADUNF_Sadunf08G0163200 [Salix dunnii]
MGVLTFTEEFSSPVEAKRLFTAMILEADSLIPQLLPQVVTSIETIEGNGGPGTIKKFTFTEGYKYFPKPDAEIKEEEIKEGKEKAAALYKVVEDYLVANPQAYA